MSEILFICKRCGTPKAPSSSDPHICEDCVKLENNRVSYFRQMNFNWMDVAKEADINLWDRQPAETDREWEVWTAYRDSYPSIKPSYRVVAEQLGTTVNVVKKCGQRWSYSARLQAWAKHCDELTMKQRQDEIVGMNKRHISMADRLADKIEAAIHGLDPAAVKPSDIPGLFKTMVEIERRARLDDAALIGTGLQLDDSNPDLKKVPAKTEDLGEVISILAQAGLLEGSSFGVKQTTTTEIVVKEE